MSVCSVAIIVAAIIIAGVNPLPAIPAPAPIPVRRVVVGVAPVPAAAHEPRKESKAVTVTEMVEMVEMIGAGKAGIKAVIKA